MPRRRTSVLAVIGTPEDPRRRGTDWLSTADDAVVACRAQGHAWPKLRPGKQDKRISAVALSDGSVRLEFACPDCGTERDIVTRPGGLYDPDARYTYRYPDGYSSPKGSALNRRDAFAEIYERTRNELLAGAGVAAPPVKFQTG